MPTDLYSLPHKAMRSAMAEAGAALGRRDPDAVDLAAAVLADLDAHGRHEDEFVHPLLRQHLPVLADELDRQHAELHELLVSTAAALTSDGAYLAFQRLVAWNLGHLDHEEAVVLPRLWHVVPDEEVAATFAAFGAAHPEAREVFLRWPDHLSGAERALVGA